MTTAGTIALATITSAFQRRRFRNRIERLRARTRDAIRCCSGVTILAEDPRIAQIISGRPVYVVHFKVASICASSHTLLPSCIGSGLTTGL